LAASATLGAAGRVAAAADRVTVVGDTLKIEGTPKPDRIRIVPTQHAGTVRAGRDSLVGSSRHDRLVAARSLGVIQVGPSVSGSALKSLSGIYTPISLQPRIAGPVVIGAADLGGAAVGAMVKRDYHGGQTIGLANATPRAAASLARMLGYPGPVNFPDGVRRAEMVAFGKIDQGGQTTFSTSILPPTVHVSVAPADRKLGQQEDARGVRAFLQGVFSPTPAVAAQANLGGDSQDLLAISNAYVQTSYYHDDSGTQLQLTTTINSVRSFDNKTDYYYVLQEVIAKAGPSSLASVYLTNSAQLQNPQGPYPVIIQPGPQSNPQATTVSSEVGWSISGTFGLSTSEGLNASLTAGVNVSNSLSTQVPPISILNQADPASGSTAWIYTFNSPPADNSSTIFADQWIWAVPWSYYEFDAYKNSFSFGSLVGYSFPTSPGDLVGQQFTDTVPVPFGQTLELDPPLITAINPKTVTGGSIFTINGANFFPSLVQGVLIGGNALDPANFTVKSNQQIQAVAPDTPGQALTVIVKSAKGYSNTNFAITVTKLQRARQLADPGRPIHRRLG
jgi:hypothetical protein